MKAVTDFPVGDEVFSYVCKLASSGTYAEYVSVPVELVAKKPASLSHAEAAAVPVAGITAAMALDKLRLNPESSLFIAGGAGGVGTFAIMLARQLGMDQLFTTAGSNASRDYLVEKCGMRENQVLDYRQAGSSKKPCGATAARSTPSSTWWAAECSRRAASCSR